MQAISSEALLNNPKAPECSYYLLLDLVTQPELKAALYQDGSVPEMTLLFIGTPYQNISEVSPCLIKVTPKMLPVLEQAKATHSGVVLESTLGLEALQQHLRAMLTAYSCSYEGKVFFRFFSVVALSAMLKENAAKLPGCLSITLPDYQAQQWYKVMQEASTPDSEPFITSTLEARMELERLAYWLGIQTEWRTHTNEAICQAADTLHCLMKQHSLTQLDSIQWSRWLSRHTKLLSTPQWSALLNASHSHQELFSQACLLADTITQEPTYG